MMLQYQDAAWCLFQSAQHTKIRFGVMWSPWTPVIYYWADRGYMIDM
jgi:hypothetical protein